MWLLRPVRLKECANLWQFIRRILTQQFLVKILVAILLALLVPEDTSTQPDFILQDPLFALVAILILAPVFETLVLQSLTIESFRLLRRSRVAQFLAGMVPFAALHFFSGIHVGVAAGIVGGIFFSHAYLECRERSWWTSTKVTTATHFFHNLIVAPIAFLAAFAS